jgi:NADH:ubiquinone oxidoreductase subunit H
LQRNNQECMERFLPTPFLLYFLICAFAETNRTPFDLAECESELIEGTIRNILSMKMDFIYLQNMLICLFLLLF